MANRQANLQSLACSASSRLWAVDMRWKQPAPKPPNGTNECLMHWCQILPSTRLIYIPRTYFSNGFRTAMDAVDTLNLFLKERNRNTKPILQESLDKALIFVIWMNVFCHMCFNDVYLHVHKLSISSNSHLFIFSTQCLWSS